MDKSQAEAIAQAMLEPDVHAREDAQRKRAAEALRQAEQRKVAWFVLVGSALGAGVAHFTGQRFFNGFVSGGLVAAAVGWLFVAWGRRRPTQSRSI